MIHVCFGLYDKQGTYSKFTGTTMLSIFENPPPPRSTTVHILHDNTLTTDNREKFIYLAGQYNQLVKFYNVEELCADKLEKIKEAFPKIAAVRHTIGMFYRFLIPSVLPADVDKCIYLDSDIIVNLDLKELWQVDLGDKPLAAAPEAVILNVYQPIVIKTKFLIINGFVDSKDYFNSGVLLMNLEHFREAYDIIREGIEFCGRHPQCDTLDQDILNYLFAKKYLKLPGKFDVFVDIERRHGHTSIGKVIYHYASLACTLEMRDPFNRLWMKYFSKTPWFNTETVEHLYERFNQIHVGLKNSMIQISAAMSGKTRAFFTAPANVDALKKIFLVRDDEEIILAENQSSLQKLIDAMNASRGKKVFIILLPYFPFQALTEAGFVFGRDFLNGFDFLSAANGLPLNSYPLIQAM